MKRSTKITLRSIAICATAGVLMITIACINSGYEWIPEIFSFRYLLGF